MNEPATALIPAPTLAAITGSGLLQRVLYLAMLFALVKPPGWFMPVCWREGR